MRPPPASRPDLSMRRAKSSSSASRHNVRIVTSLLGRGRDVCSPLCANRAASCSKKLTSCTVETRPEGGSKLNDLELGEAEGGSGSSSWPEGETQANHNSMLPTP